jgi:pSer/pThr/pTyr-binding forkhead associated (FHA) protein
MCNNCGRDTRPGDLYCKYCGQRLHGLQSGLLSAYSSGSGDLGGGQSYSTSGASQSAPSTNTSSASNGAQQVGRLVVRPLPGKSGGQTRETPLDGRDIAIGRSPTCDVMLEDDQLVSRRHALLRYNGSEYTIVDLGSSNGTFLNEEEIHQATTLRDGDLIGIGEYEILYSKSVPLSPDDSQAVAQAPQDITGASAALETTPEPESEAESEAELESGPQPEPQPEPVASASEPAWPAPAAPAITAAAVVATAVAATAQEATERATQPPTPQTPAMLAEETRAPADTRPNRSGDNLPDPRATATNLEAFRTQLGQASTLLLRLDEETRISETRRAALQATRDEIATILEQQGGSAQPGAAPGGGADVASLTAIVRKAADHPRDLDNVMQLSQHASEIADALAAQQSSGGVPPALINQLAGLKKRLDELL